MYWVLIQLSKMGYIRGGLGKKGHVVVVPITLELKSPKVGLRYDEPLLTTRHDIKNTHKVLFIVGGI